MSTNNQLQDFICKMFIQSLLNDQNQSDQQRLNQYNAKCRYCGMNGHFLKDCSYIEKSKQQWLINRNRNRCDHCGMSNHQRPTCNHYLKAKARLGNSEPIGLSELIQQNSDQLQESVFQTRGASASRQGGIQCSYCGIKGHMTDKCRPMQEAVKEWVKNRQENPCSHCGMVLHERSCCPLYRKAKDRLIDKEPVELPKHETMTPLLELLTNSNNPVVPQNGTNRNNQEIKRCTYCGIIGHDLDHCQIMLKAIQEWTNNYYNSPCEHCGRVGHERIDCNFYKQAKDRLRNRGEPVSMTECSAISQKKIMEQCRDLNI